MKNKTVLGNIKINFVIMVLLILLILNMKKVGGGEGKILVYFKLNVIMEENLLIIS
jgi:hypothetical protein